VEDIQYQYHLKIISYKIESNNFLKRQLSQDNTEIKNDISSFGNKNNVESISHDYYSNTKTNSFIKNYIKLIFTIQPNTLEETKLLTITMIDYSETLNEDQLKNIIQDMFSHFKEIIIKEIPFSKNSESIIIDANINIVFNFWLYWHFPYMGDEHISNIKIEGDPKKVGTKIKYLYLKKYHITSVVLEINSFFQEGNEDDNNEWNYKHKIKFESGEEEIFNIIFVSCENGTKAFLSVENDINSQIQAKELDTLSKRKLALLIRLKNYIEKNIVFLTDLNQSLK
jgi:hypothetical protein